MIYDKLPWCIHDEAFIDEGVKGMKRGKHVKARDPEYRERLQKAGELSTDKKIALGVGAGAAALGSILLGRKLLGGKGAKATKAVAKSSEKVGSKAESMAKKAKSLGETGSHSKISTHSNASPKGKTINPAKASREELRQALSDPNGTMIFDI